jgi:hypothetical protein
MQARSIHSPILSTPRACASARSVTQTHRRACCRQTFVHKQRDRLKHWSGRERPGETQPSTHSCMCAQARSPGAVFSALTTTNMKATAIMVRIRMPTHIRADRHPGLSIVGLRLPSSAEPCPWPGFGGGTRMGKDESPRKGTPCLASSSIGLNILLTLSSRQDCAVVVKCVCGSARS